MKIKQISWEPHENGDLKGMLNSKEVFTIKQSKKSGQYEVLSWGMPSDIFRSGSQISLGIFMDIEQAKITTQRKLEEYINLFLETAEIQSSPLTLVDEIKV